MRLFDVKEQVKVGLWLKGELGKNQESTYQLFELMCNKKVTIEQIWASLYPKKAFPEKPFYDSGFRRLEHSLSSLLEVYLAFQAFRRDEEGVDLYLLRELNNRDAKELFAAKYKKAKKKLEDQPVRDETYQRKLYRLLLERVQFTVKFEPRDYKEAFLDIIRQFRTTHIYERMRAALNLDHYLTTSKNKKQISDIQSLAEVPKDWLMDKNLKQNKVLNIYYQISLMNRGKDLPVGFDRQIRDNINLFHENVRKDVYVMLLNYHGRPRMNENELERYYKLVELYEWGIGAKFLYIGDLLREVVYRNLIYYCIMSGQLGLARKYLEDLKKDLSLDIREEAYIFSLGRILMAEENYSDAKVCFQKKFSRLDWEIRARKYLIQIRYEKGERDELENEIRALNLFLGRKEGIHPKLQLNIETELKMIHKLIRSFKTKELLRLKTEVNEDNLMSDKKWILNKIDAKIRLQKSSILD
ncbi:MAG: hypothetical protein AAFP89_20950 [Bacteroidota bacterium]